MSTVHPNKSAFEARARAFVGKQNGRGVGVRQKDAATCEVTEYVADPDTGEVHSVVYDVPGTDLRVVGDAVANDRAAFLKGNAPRGRGL